MIITRRLLIFLLLLSSSFSFGQSRYEILLLTGRHVPEAASAERIAATKAAEAETEDNKYFRIIQFNNIPSADEVADLRKNGVELLDYVPNYAYYASINRNTSFGKTERVGNIRAVIPVLPIYKLHPSLTGKSFPSHAEVVKGKIDLIVSCFRNVNSADAQNLLLAKGAEMLLSDPLSNVYRLRINKDEIQKFAEVSFVQYLEPIEQIIIENATGKSLHRSNTINTAAPNGLKYDGTGVGVSIGDGPYFFPHIDFAGRYTGPTGTEDHATHVAGTVGGAGNINPRMEGQAPGVNMRSANYFTDISSLSAITNLYNSADKIRVTNHSLGEGLNAGYNSTARMGDLEVESLPNLFNVHSSGNSGDNFYTITGGYKAAKNSIATGNLNSYDIIASSSSRGPSADGRIKPDLCAKGTSVFSTMPGNNYDAMTGTSMASPGVTGCVSQLIHAYRDINGGQDPKLAMLKSVMLNTAEDLGNKGPDYTYGWGRVNVWRAYNTIKDARYFFSEISDGESKTHTITVPANVKELKVMVYWADPAAASGVSKALINDLDISVTGDAGIELPWSLNKTAPSDAAIKGADHDNNMEQVVISAPAEGEYTINVNGFLVPKGPQEYWVTYEFVQDEIKLTYPIGGENFAPTETQTIRWDALGTADPFTIEYSVDGGSNWTMISSSVSGASRYYNWKVPPVLTGRGMIRVSRSGVTGQSDTTFSIIAVPTGVKVASRCAGEFTLAWNTVGNATAYEVFVLGQKYMVSQGVTTLTSFTLPISSTKETWATVRALADSGKIVGRRANAVLVPTTTTSCLQKPVAAFSASTTSTSCSGTIAFKDESASSPSSWYWEFGDGGTSTVKDPVHTYSINGTFTIKLVVTNAVGTDTLVKTNYVTVNLSSPPPAPVSRNASNVGATSFTASWVAGAGYYLDVATDEAFTNLLSGYNNVFVDSDSSLDISGISCGTNYYYRLRSVNNCGTTSSSVITLTTVDADPLAPEVYASEKTGATTFTAAWSPVANATGYFIDVATDAEFSNIVTAYNNYNVGNVTTANITGLAVNTGYHFRVRSQSACGESPSSNTVSFRTTQHVYVYPNPVEGQLGVNISDLDYSQLELQVTTFLGQVVFSETFTSQSAVTINVESLPTGVYFLTLKIDGEEKMVRLLKK